MRRCLAHLDKRSLDAVLFQYVARTIEVLDRGIRADAHAVPYALVWERRGLYRCFHTQQREPGFQIICVGGILKRAGLQKKRFPSLRG